MSNVKIIVNPPRILLQKLRRSTERVSHTDHFRVEIRTTVEKNREIQPLQHIASVGEPKGKKYETQC